MTHAAVETRQAAAFYGLAATLMLTSLSALVVPMPAGVEPARS